MRILEWLAVGLAALLGVAIVAAVLLIVLQWVMEKMEWART